jgi:glc operon protein GlcG
MALDLATAKKIVEASIARAQEAGVKLAIAVVDQGGNLVHLSRMDGAPFLAPQIATGKAYTAAGFGVPSGVIEQRAQARAAFFASVSTITQGRAAIGKGALPIIENGQVIGAVGASGGTPDQDEDAVRAGIAAVQ